MKTIEPLLSPQGQCLWHYIQAALDTIRQANRAINSRESLQSMIYYLNQADPLVTLTAINNDAFSTGHMVLEVETIIKNIRSLCGVLERICYDLPSRSNEHAPLFYDPQQNLEWGESKTYKSLVSSNREDPGTKTVESTGLIPIATQKNEDTIYSSENLLEKQRSEFENLSIRPPADFSKMSTSGSKNDHEEALLKADTGVSSTNQINVTFRSSTVPNDSAEQDRIVAVQNPTVLPQLVGIASTAATTNISPAVNVQSSKINAKRTVDVDFSDLNKLECMTYSELILTNLEHLCQNRILKSLIIQSIQTVQGTLQPMGGLNYVNTDAIKNVNFALALANLRILTEGICGKASLDALIVSADKLHVRIAEDAVFCNILQHGASIIMLAVNASPSVTSKQLRENGAKCIHDLRNRIEEKHPNDSAELVYRINDVLLKIINNYYIATLASRFQKISSLIWSISEGRCYIHPHLVRDLFSQIMPAAVREMVAVAIPRMVHTSHSYDICLDSFKLNISSMMPEYISAKVVDEISLGLRNSLTCDTVKKLSIEMTHIVPQIKDISFAFIFKNFLTRIADKGFASVNMPMDTGCSVSIDLDMFPDHPSQTLCVRRVKVDLEKLHITVSKTKHDLIYRMLSSMIDNTIQRHIARTLETYIAQSVSTLNTFLTLIKGPGVVPTSFKEKLNCHFDRFMCALRLDGGNCDSMLQKNLAAEQQELSDSAWPTALVLSKAWDIPQDEQADDIDALSTTSQIQPSIQDTTVVDSTHLPWYTSEFNLSSSTT
ncbi:hypothetical protein RTP6_000509 [Batrachochytrium dendrobatidis]